MSAQSVSPDVDTSYVLRLPNSGGVLLNGKPYADALRANPANPNALGHYVPVEGTGEWHLGAGALANDPRDRRRNNAMLNFVKPKMGANKHLRDLAYVPRWLQPSTTRLSSRCGSNPRPLASAAAVARRTLD